jgi:alpha-L-fucosidase 2
MLGTPAFGGALQPIGDLVLQSAADTAGSDFVRSLDLATGVVRFAWTWPDGRSVIREIVAARRPSVFVVRQRATMELGVARADFSSPFGFAVSEISNSTLVGGGRWHEVQPNRRLVADSYRLRDYTAGLHLRFAAGLRVIEGDANAVDGTLELSSSDWTVAVAVGTDFGGGDPVASVGELLENAERSAEHIVGDAIVAHAEVFGRASVRLATPDPLAALTTDRRIHAMRAGAVDDHLILLLADYGRYLQIASTLGGTLPPTLQGIWNPDTEPAWSSNYTLNINLQMNLWSADAFRFPEALAVLGDFVAQLANAGHRTAAELYGAKGWVVHHNSDLWLNTAPTTMVEVGLFAGAGLWLVQQLRQHQDSYPESADVPALFELVRGLVEFFETWLVVDSQGYLATSPSSTPENAYLLDGNSRPRSRADDPEFQRHGWIGEASTLEMLLVRDTLRTAVELGSRLGVPAGDLASWTGMLERLRPVVCQDGEIPEWTWPYRALELGHRHLSPLYALYPGEHDFERSAELRSAAWATLANRQANVASSSNGWGGWSKVWAAACWARLGEGDRSLASLEALMRTGVAPDSLLHAFPDFDGAPAADAVHQSDANMGVAAAVIELLMRSVPGSISLLPALPARWTDGGLRGIRARGGVDIDFTWSDSRVVSGVLLSSVSQTVVISAPGPTPGARQSQRVKLPPNTPVSVTFDTHEPELQEEASK